MINTERKKEKKVETGKKKMQRKTKLKGKK